MDEPGTTSTSSGADLPPPYEEPPRTLRRTVRSWFWLSMQTDDGWTDVTEDLQLPAAVRARFRLAHPEVDKTRLSNLDEAFAQWVRILGRRGALVVQPSAAVDSAWQIVAADAVAWASLPAHVRELTHVGLRGPHALTEDADQLHETYSQAHFDEMPTGRLPAVFRVDEELGIVGGRLYTTTCTPNCGSIWWQRPARDPDRICLHSIPFVPTPNDSW